MTEETLTLNTKFIINGQGRRTHAVIPIKEYERLLEDDYDNDVAVSREHDDTISSKEFKRQVSNRQVSS